MIETSKLIIQETAAHQFHLVRNLFVYTARRIKVCEFVARSLSVVENIEGFYFKLIEYNIQSEHGLYKSPDSMN